MTAIPGVTFIAPEDVSAETSLTRTDEITAIPHEKLHDHPANPAGRVEMHAIAELLQSIDRFGQREPVRVRDAGPIGHYQILSGHRRAAACRMLDRDVRCEVVDCSDEEALREVMLGNADRKDLDPIERAELLQQMIDAGMDREQAGALFGLESERIGGS